MELSLDYFLENTVKWPKPQIDGSSLADKLIATTNYMKNNNIMSNDELSPALKAVSGQTLLVATIKTMNGYVHSRYYSPVGSELKTAWDDLQLFLEKVWV